MLSSARARAGRLLSAAARRHSSTHLAALIERSPQLTPELREYERELVADMETHESWAKVYPEALTAAEEGPDRQRARLRLEALLESDGGREGEGDRTGDTRSLDRHLSQRLYLLTRRAADEPWALPQRAWVAPESVRDGLAELVRTRCGDELAVHQMGNAPMAHRKLFDGGSVFFWKVCGCGWVVVGRLWCPRAACEELTTPRPPLPARTPTRPLGHRRPPRRCCMSRVAWRCPTEASTCG